MLLTGQACYAVQDKFDARSQVRSKYHKSKYQKWKHRSSKCYWVKIPQE